MCTFASCNMQKEGIEFLNTISLSGANTIPGVTTGGMLSGASSNTSRTGWAFTYKDKE